MRGTSIPRIFHTIAPPGMAGRNPRAVHTEAGPNLAAFYPQISLKTRIIKTMKCLVIERHHQNIESAEALQDAQKAYVSAAVLSMPEKTSPVIRVYLR